MNLFLGDIHGEFVVISRLLKKYDLTNCNIIQVGDFGVGFLRFEKEYRQLKSLNETLVKRNVNLYAIRGNHDFPDYFKNDPFNLSNIHLLDDYTILELNGKKILLVGGAISVDRGYRKTKYQKSGDFKLRGNESWWNNETFVLDEEKLNSINGVDIVVTHTTTGFCNPNIEFGVGPFVNNMIKEYNDHSLYFELLEERKSVDRMFDILKPNNNIKKVYYGHFHKSDMIENDGIVFRCLDINELYMDE